MSQHGNCFNTGQQLLLHQKHLKSSGRASMNRSTPQAVVPWIIVNSRYFPRR